MFVRTSQLPFGALSTLSMIDDVRRQLDRAFAAPELGLEAFVGLPRPGRDQPRGAWVHAAPRLLAKETETAWVLTAEAPGVTESDVSLTVADGILTLKATRAARAPDGYTAKRQERGALMLERSIALPEGVDAGEARAVLEHGILTITLPKRKEATPRRIEIRSA